MSIREIEEKAKESYEAVEREIEKIEGLLATLAEKKRELRRELKKFRLPHYCPFCGSENLVKPPEFYEESTSGYVPSKYVLRGYYLCGSCDRGFKLGLVTPYKRGIIKQAIEKRR